MLRGAEGAITLVTDAITADILDKEPQLKVVSNFAVGYDNIDAEAATARGVAVCNTPGVLTETTADFAFALLIGGAAGCRRRRLRPRWQMANLGSDPFPWPRSARRNPRHRRVRPDRQRDGETSARVRHDDPRL